MENTLEIATIGRAAAESAPLDFDLMVRQHQRRIYRVLLGMVRDPELAGNLTQDCFVRAYLRADPSGVRTDPAGRHADGPGSAGRSG